MHAVKLNTYFNVHCYWLIELLFVFVEIVFIAPRSEELGIAT